MVFVPSSTSSRRFYRTDALISKVAPVAGPAIDQPSMLFE